MHLSPMYVGSMRSSVINMAQPVKTVAKTFILLCRFFYYAEFSALLTFRCFLRKAEIFINLTKTMIN